MPTLMPEGIRLPAGDDSYDLTNDLRRMMESATTITIAPNTAAREALLAALATAGRPASALDPVYVHQSDTGTTWKHDGTGWRGLGVPETFTGGRPDAGAATASKTVLALTVPAAPYARRLLINGTLTGLAISNLWDGGLSAGISTVAEAQRFSRLPNGSSVASVSMTMTYGLPAGASTVVRLWARRVTDTASSITINESTQYTNLDVVAFQV